MRLASGTRFGRYEIVTPLGAGGMGEVYQAHDSRLNRSVAIKILPLEVAADPEFRARFRREAETLAGLQHPHICVLYDVVDVDATTALVMEHLEGETLADRLRRGPLPLGQSLRYAIEIVSGLAAAHRQGINHRDLKPGNIMVTPAGAKLLDFGLAKPRRAIAAGVQSAALTADAVLVTARGVILGTLGYMAPEQLEGNEADARSDIFALGAILYEMTTGKRAFEGESQASLIAGILTGEPSAAALDERGAPPLFNKIVLKCLAKNPDERWQSAHDLADMLCWIDQETPAADREAASLSTRSRLPWIGAAAAAVAVSIAITALAFRRPPADLTPLRLSVVAPPGTTFTARDITGHPQFALSPDGSRLAFVAARRGERPLLWVRSLETGAAQPLPGTEDASGPFWAPDSQSLAFFTRRKLMRVSLGGAPPQGLVDVAVDVTSGAWNADGVILFATGEGLFRVPAGGGPVTLTSPLDSAKGETGNRWPQFLPDGRRFLLHVSSVTAQSSGVYVSGLDTESKTQLLQSRANAVYADPGYLLFEQNGSLTGQRFDASSGELSGQPIALGDQILGLFGPSYLPLSAARDGTLAYWNGSPPPTELQWLDRTGRLLSTVETSAARSDSLALSPAATRLLVTLRPNPNQNEIWRIDLSSGVASRLTFLPPGGRFGIWSSDGQSVVFGGAGAPLYQKPASGEGKETVVPGPLTHYAIFPEDWSRDNRWLIYSATAKTAWDMWALDLTTNMARPILNSSANEVMARLSPDGRWLAYTSDESGAWEVYVQPFPDGGGKWQVSSGGGSQPLWRGDAKELFYLAGDGRVIAVTLGGGPTFEPQPIEPLFQTRVPPVLAPFRSGYAVSPDGQRFLLNNIVADSEPSAITVVRHWQAGLKTP